MLKFLLVLALLLLGPTGRAATIKERAAPCLACHGESGQSEIAEVPSLGGQPSFFLLIQTFMFRSGQRVAPPMNEMLADFSDADLQALADFIARLPPPKPRDEPGNPARMAAGEALAAQHRCAFCHNADYSGREQMPRLAAQREDYLVKTMRDYKSGARPGYEPVMNEVLYGISDAQILDLAHYLAHFR